MLTKNFKNVVLLDQVINLLNIDSDGIYVDATFGEGGHSKAILSYLNSNGRLFIIDCDSLAIEIAKVFAKEDSRLIVIHGRFSKLFKYIKDYNLIGRVNGILLDLGISRLQLEDNNRGFSFMRNGLLDMRMDINCNLSAFEWLRTATLEKITWVLKTFGEEKFARRIANSIVEYRRSKKLLYTHELVQLIIRAIPYSDKYKHPATRTFQAIRMYINNELKEITDVLHAALSVLAPSGRLLIISFHSLEDRIVKRFIRQYSISLDCEINKNYDDNQFFSSCESSEINRYKYYIKFIDRVFPSKEEIERNVCSRSAILRCAEKVIII